MFSGLGGRSRPGCWRGAGRRPRPGATKPATRGGLVFNLKKIYCECIIVLSQPAARARAARQTTGAARSVVAAQVRMARRTCVHASRRGRGASQSHRRQAAAPPESATATQTEARAHDARTHETAAARTPPQVRARRRSYKQSNGYKGGGGGAAEAAQLARPGSAHSTQQHGGLNQPSCRHEVDKKEPSGVGWHQGESRPLPGAAAAARGGGQKQHAQSSRQRSEPHAE